MKFYLHIHDAMLLGERYRARIEQGGAGFHARTFVTVELMRTHEQICGRQPETPRVRRVFAVESHLALKQAQAILARIEAT